MIESSEIERMSVTERLQAMDQIWDSLTRDADEIPSPDWHQDVLADRKARAQRGEALPQKSEPSANGAIYKSQGQARAKRSASPLDR